VSQSEFSNEAAVEAPVSSRAGSGLDTPVVNSLPAGITSEEVREELQRVVGSADFPATPRNRQVLSYAVERALQGGADASRVTAVDIATQVFGRLSDFNPLKDPIVRVEVARLRKDLETYYLKSGRRNPLRIDLPRGGYNAVFSRPEEREEIAADVPAATGVLAEDAAAELRRIIASPDFPAIPRNRRFLSYVVQKELAGTPEEISARFVGMVVFERGPRFSQTKDPIVRIEAAKLRRDMEIYYLKSGRHNPLQILLPKGSYRPVFHYRSQVGS
jgi:hypothetical protein